MMRIRPPSFRILLASLLLCCGMLGPGGSHGLAAGPDEIKKFEEAVSQHRQKMEKVQTGIANHQKLIAASQKREEKLLEELKKIDRQIQDENARLASLQEQLNRQNELTIAKQKELAKVAQEKETLQQHTEKRLAAYYRMGDIGVMNVIFSSSSLADLLSFQENFKLLLKNDRQLIAEFKSKMNELEAARQAHEQEKLRLTEATEEVMKQQATLTASQQERQKLLARVTTERELYQEAVKELEAAASQLTATLTELEKQESEAKKEQEKQERQAESQRKSLKKTQSAAGQGFAGEKGRLPLPAAGPIVQQFGEHTDKASGASTVANGITIETAPGSEVRAIYDGKVVYAGTLRGYGNLIIIDHGRHYYSLVSGLGEIGKKVGDQVKQLEKIGRASLHTGVLQEGLHFEIRHQTEPQNPLDWVDASQLTPKK